jgi:hypothetical protein
VNTSAQIEAAIVGRVVCTVRDDAFVHSQEGTLHFQHLVNPDGLLTVAGSLTEHTSQLGRVLRGDVPDAERSRRFVEAFVRPFGRHEAATPRLAAHIIELGAMRSAMRSRPARPGRAALVRPFVSMLVWWSERRPLWAYALRACFAIVVETWAIPYRLRTTIDTVARPLRRGALTVSRLPIATHKTARRYWRESIRPHVRGVAIKQQMERTVGTKPTLPPPDRKRQEAAAARRESRRQEREARRREGTG